MQPFSAQVSGTATAVKTAPCRIYGWQLLNTTAAIAYVQIFDATTANVTLGSTAANYIIPLAANGSQTILTDVLRNAISCVNACTIACTTTRTGSTGAAVDVLMWADTSV